MRLFTRREFGRIAALATVMVLGAPTAVAASMEQDLLEPENSISAPAVSLVHSGKCGENVNWGIGTDNVLYIYGNGPMYDFGTDAGKRAPWAEKLLQSAADGSALATIQTVQVCEGVTTLGAFSFNTVVSGGYPALSTIVLPNTLQEVGRRALFGCPALSSIQLSEANSYFTVQDGILFNKAMDRLVRCPAMSGPVAYTIPASVTMLDEGAFAYNKVLESVVLPEGMTEVKDCAFQSCSSLREVTFPQSLKNLKYACFGWCTSLNSVALPEGTETLDWAVFTGCSSLSSVSIPRSVKKIDIHAFSGCPLKEVKISKDCKLGSQAFNKDVKIKYYF